MVLQWQSDSWWLAGGKAHAEMAPGNFYRFGLGATRLEGKSQAVRSQQRQSMTSASTHHPPPPHRHLLLPLVRLARLAAPGPSVTRPSTFDVHCHCRRRCSSLEARSPAGGIRRSARSACCAYSLGLFGLPVFLLRYPRPQNIDRISFPGPYVLSHCKHTSQHL